MLNCLLVAPEEKGRMSTCCGLVSEGTADTEMNKILCMGEGESKSFETLKTDVKNVLYWGADKSLARPGRKKATVTKF